MGRKIYGLLGIARRNLAVLPMRVKSTSLDKSPHLGYERNQLPEVLGLLVRIDLKYLTDAVIVIPLLKELFLVSCRVPLNQVLQLRQVCSQENATTHGSRIGCL